MLSQFRLLLCFRTKTVRLGLCVYRDPRTHFSNSHETLPAVCVREQIDKSFCNTLRCPHIGVTAAIIDNIHLSLFLGTCKIMIIIFTFTRVTQKRAFDDFYDS